MSSLYEAAILNAWRRNNDIIDFDHAKNVYFEIYFEKHKSRYSKDFLTNMLENLKKTFKNYNLNYDTRRIAEVKYEQYTSFNTDEERLKSYLRSHFDASNASSVNKILRKYGRNKTFNKGVWIYDPENANAVTSKMQQDHLYYKTAYEHIIKAFNKYITESQTYNSCFKTFKDNITVEWMLPNNMQYFRCSKIVLKLNVGPAYFEFNFDVRRFSVGMANLWTSYNYTDFSADENNLIYFTERGDDSDFYELFNEIDKNTSFILSFIKK
jgi:hypothetical protein